MPTDDGSDSDQTANADANAGVRRSAAHPRYWEYDGEPTVLLGGTDTDNLFQWTGEQLADQLDGLVAAGGNYVRNTLSDRGGNDVRAFAEVNDGVYDLERWNEPFWERLEAFLDETAARDIVVQLTLWDQHDFNGDRWAVSPWNSANNDNYGRYDSGLAGWDDFFGGVDRNPVVYPHQRRFVDRVLDLTLGYDHVLYNVNNESSVGEEWERHWAEHVRSRADEAGEEVDVTSMNMWPGRSVATVLRNRDLYSYVDVSQVNQDSKGEAGQAHWDAVQSWRAEVDDALGPRPFTNVKIYGGEGEHGSFGSPEEAVERFWRNLVGGCASVRFHRPMGADRVAGLGQGDRARAHLRSARLLLDAVELIELSPRNDLLSDRQPNEAYCAATSERTGSGGRYVVYFPDGGAVGVDISDEFGSLRVRWLRADESEWAAEMTVKGGDRRRLSAPGEGNWVAVVGPE